MLLQAGDAYSRANSYDSAVACFEKAGDVTRWVDALAKKGEMFEAATVALDQGDRSRAIQYLSEVGGMHPRYPEAVVRLAEAFRADGHFALAARKIEELQATRGDIREEIDRLKAHVEQARELLASSDPVGRRLDFLSQEFNREANTLCSKSGDVQLTRVGMDLKTVIDRLREQVQNVE